MLALAPPPPPPPPADTEAPPALVYRWKIDLSLTAALGAFVLVTEAAKAQLEPGACRFCEPPTIDAEAQGALRWGDPDPARHASDALAWVLVPGLALGWDFVATSSLPDRGRMRAVDLGLMAEAGAIALALDQTVKFAAGRERPFVHARAPADRLRLHDPDDDLSFYSGHTTLSFALAVSAGEVAELRGYREAPWIWASGLAAASLTGYLRIAADKHWLSDVVTGAAVGAAVGALVPLLHGARRGRRGQGGRPLGISLVPYATATSRGLLVAFER